MFSFCFFVFVLGIWFFGISFLLVNILRVDVELIIRLDLLFLVMVNLLKFEVFLLK